MLRPATPLSIIFFLAFVLLLLSTLSTPIIKAIPLATYQGYNLGVFGWCKDGKCSPITVGYNTDGLFSGTSADDFSLPVSTRNSLSSILIVHPIATLLTLVCFCLAVAAHFHSPSSSPRYLLALLILTVPTLLVTLLAFLVDILLFVPHMQWGGWIVLAATILIIASSVVTCAMRRTLVSRKARKKRIAENAEMSGANYYENLNQQRMMTDATLPRADSPPPMSGSTAVDKGMPQFAAFEMKNRDADSNGMQSPNDDRTPLNPSIRSRSMDGDRRRPYAEDAPPMPVGRPSMESQGRPRRPSRDQYGNPIPPAASLRHQGSDGSMRSHYSSRSRGRGGAPRGYGGSRADYGPPPRGGFQSRGAYRGGPPPPGWSGRGRGGFGPPPPGMRGPPQPGRFAPPPGYVNDGGYYGAAAVPTSRSVRSLSTDRPPPEDAFVAGPVGMPIGQAVEMDEHTGSPQNPASPTHGVYQDQQPNYGLRDSDADVTGMVGLQQDRSERPPVNRMDSMGRSEGGRSPTSIYSADQQYVPPRSQWQQPEQRQYTTSPLATNARPAGPPLPLSPAQDPAPLPQPRHKRSASEPYYEDVDPRFAIVEPSDDGYSHHSAIPNALTPGPGTMPGMPGGFPATPGAPQQRQDSYGMMAGVPSNPSYAYQQRTRTPVNPEYLHAGYHNTAGAPAIDGAERSNSASSLDPQHASGSYDGGSERASEASHFTSISERPVNPNWQPPPGSVGAPSGAPSGGAPAVQRQRDMILGENPDFSIPGVRGTRGRTGGVPVAASTVGGGSMPAGRYPTEF